MNETLRDLYQRFYTLPEIEVENAEVERVRRVLSERLNKSERKLLLRIIDAKDRATCITSLDSFICGFRLAVTITSELKSYENGRPERVARSTCEEDKI